MNLVIQLLTLLPAIIKAVKEIEAAFPAGSGKEKLSVVVGAVESALGEDGADVKTKLVPAVVSVTEKVVAAFNALGIFKKA